MYNGTITKDEDIDYLIKCAKVFRTNPKSPTHINRNVTQNFTVYGKDNELKLSIFITYSERIPQDFSIGLMFNNMLLLRLNGFHGTTRSGFYISEHHAYPHCHRLSTSDIEKGRSKKPSTIQDLTGKYVNLQTAIVFFVKSVV